MLFADDSLVWTVTAVGLVALGAFLIHRFAPHERERRKRRRNYGTVVSRARRPMVRLSVNTRA